MDAGSGSEYRHESGGTRLLAISYLDAILSMRLTADTTKLRPVDTTQGWLGNITTNSVVPVAHYKGSLVNTAWLPNEKTARKWQQYGAASNLSKLVQKVGLKRAEKLEPLFNFIGLRQTFRQSQISPSQKPSAPTDLQITRNKAGENSLGWHFTPDLETGIPSFRIYRDDRLIRTVRGQQHNFGDAPEPPEITLEFWDEQANSRSTYTVAAFNALGESFAQVTPSVDSK